MSFLFPGFLWGLTAISIPVIIHLFNFRRYKTVYFPNVAFLKEVKEKTNSQSQLKKWLVLIARILALSALVFAFAQPFIPGKNTKAMQGLKSVSIYIDNSFSMNSRQSEVPLIELAKKKAREIVDAYGTADKFQLITNDFEGKHQRLTDKETMLEMIDEVHISPAVKKISAVIGRQKEALNTGQSALKLIYLLSDFQTSSSDLENVKVDSTVRIFALDLEASRQENIYIDTSWMSNPVQMISQPSKLLVKIVNGGSEPIEKSRLTLNINGQVKSISDFSVAEKSFTIDTIVFTVTNAGWNKADLSLQESGDIDYDNTYYFAFDVPEKLSVLCISQSGPNKFITAIFGSNPLFSFRDVTLGQINYSELGKQHFIILNSLTEISSGLASALEKFVDGGGNLLVLPASNSNINSYNTFLSSVKADQLKSWNNTEKQVSSLNTSNQVFTDVFIKIPQNLALPKSKGNFLFSEKTFANTESIMTYKDQQSMLVQYQYGKGSVFLSGVPFDLAMTDLVVSPVFAPMVFRMCISQNEHKSLSYFIGRDQMSELKTDASGEANFKMKGNGDEFIPQQRIINSTLFFQPAAFAKNAGSYNLISKSGDAVAAFGLNFDRLESDLNFLNGDPYQAALKKAGMEEMASADKNLTAVIHELNLGTTLWKLCFLLALIFLAIEVLLLRFLK